MLPRRTGPRGGARGQLVIRPYSIDHGHSSGIYKLYQSRSRFARLGGPSLYREISFPAASESRPTRFACGRMRFYVLCSRSYSTLRMVSDAHHFHPVCFLPHQRRLTLRAISLRSYAKMISVTLWRGLARASRSLHIRPLVGRRREIILVTFSVPTSLFMRTSMSSMTHR